MYKDKYISCHHFPGSKQAHISPEMPIELWYLFLPQQLFKVLFLKVKITTIPQLLYFFFLFTFHISAQVLSKEKLFFKYSSNIFQPSQLIKLNRETLSYSAVIQKGM